MTEPLTLPEVTADNLRDRGVTVAAVARRAGITSDRLYRALTGYTPSWLTVEEQGRLGSALEKLGLIRWGRGEPDSRQ
jgi:hypothetical protein